MVTSMKAAQLELGMKNEDLITGGTFTIKALMGYVAVFIGYLRLNSL